MIEAHAHLASLGQSLAMPNLAKCASLAECLDLVRTAASRASPGDWVRMTGARPAGWKEQRWPTLAELDAAAPARPLVLLSFDHHMGVANSAALKAAGLHAGQRVEPNGLVLSDPATGAPSGLLMEAAAITTWNAAPDVSPERRAEQVQAALAHLAALGYQEVHDLHSQEWLGPLLAGLERQGPLPLNVRLYPPIAKLESVAAGRQGWESARVRLCGGKLFADGTLNARTACVLEAYRQPAPESSPFGTMMATPDQLDEAVRTAERVGLHLAVHAIGDGAVRATLDAIERVSRKPLSTPIVERHRVEHCELIDERDVPRFASLGVVCSVQPCHLLTDIEVLTRELPHRLSRVLPLRDLVDNGCRPQGGERTGLLWFGSDAPIVPADPKDSIQAAVHRRRTGMPASDAIGIEQGLTAMQAWACFGVSPSAF